MTEDKKNTASLPGPMDYEKLLEYGLSYIRSIGSRFWTDFNVHDPGVTILEALTLALTDLSYRSSAAMADLLTRPGGNTPSLEGAMFPANVILPNAPTTIDDYRKLILENIPGVRNVWLNTVDQVIDIPYIPNKTTSRTATLSGYYDVLVELEGLDTIRGDADILAVIGKDIDGSLCADHVDADNVEPLYRHCIRNLLLKHRNMGENFRDIKFLKPVKVGICAEIEINSDVDVRSLLQDIYDRMYDYVSPAIPFHSVEELLSTGREADEIFSLRTPLLGFIDADELRTFSRKTDLYASDAIGILMAIPGIKAIRHIHFITDENEGGVLSEYDGRHVQIDPSGDLSFSMSPLFHRNQRVSRSLFVNNIIFQRAGLTFFPPEGADGLSVHPKEDEKKPLPAGFITSLPLPKGTYRSTDRYFSFQNLFPASYRMGVDSIPESASALRKAERMQLKAYLTFFDQALADYLAQLDHLQDLLAIKEKDNHTYFHHGLQDTDIVDVSKVLKDHPGYRIPPDNQQTDLARKNSILNHLLSRFADSFAEYTALEFVRKGYEDEFTLLECVEDKKRFLRDYPRISSLRSSGLDWTSSGLTLRVSGAERRIMRKLGVNEPDQRKQLSKQDGMGLYLIEHNLLVPESVDEAFLQLESGADPTRLLDDPYSFRVTAVLPGWPELAGNLHYRKYVETIIREELPAHIFVKICWVSREVMAILEDAYQKWYRTMFLGARFPSIKNWKSSHAKVLRAMVDALGQFSNIYQTAVVMPDDTMDYVDDESITRLDFTFLGSEDYHEETPKDQGTVEPQTDEKPAEPETDEKPIEPKPADDGQNGQPEGFIPVEPPTDTDSKPAEPETDEKPIEPEADSKPAEPKADEKPIEPEADSKPTEPKADEKPVEPKPAEEPQPKAAPEDVEYIIRSLCDCGPKTLGALIGSGPKTLGALIGSGPQTLGSLIEGLRQDKENQH